MNSNSIAQAAETTKTDAQRRMEHANFIRLCRADKAHRERQHAMLVEQHRLFGGIFEDSADLVTA